MISLEGVSHHATNVAPEAVEQGLTYGHDPRINRFFSGLLLLAAVVVLVGSFALAPSPAGWGTHHLLFMPPCLFHYFTGIPCPFCGMTTAFAHMARGEVVAAFECHALGPVAYLLTWPLGIAALLGLIRGRWPLPEFVMSARFNRGLIIVVLVAWAVNIVRALAL